MRAEAHPWDTRVGERCTPWRAGSQVASPKDVCGEASSQAKGFGEIEVDNVSFITIAKSAGNAVVNYALATRAVRRMR